MLIQGAALNVRLQLSLDENRLARWLVRVEDGYRANPYHNKIHAADVLRTSHVLLTRGGCGGAPAPDDLTQLAVYLAAVSTCNFCFTHDCCRNESQSHICN